MVGKQLFKYEEVSNSIQRMIEQGALKSGEKLQSVRSLSKKQNISLSTANKAYEELIIKGLIEARPKSGYYVRGGINISDVSVPKEQVTIAEPRGTDQIVSFAFRKLSREGIVRLSISGPDVSLLPQAKLNKSMAEALRKSETSCLGYEDAEGNVELRRQIVRHTFGEGSCDPEEVIITQGCVESLVLCLMTVTKPGDTVIIERPTYFSIYNTLRNLGLKAIEINVHPRDGMDLDYLQECLRQYPVSACIFIPNFSNPTGHLMKDKTKQKLVGILSKANVPLIEDDIYGEIYFGSSRPRTCKSFDESGMVMLCASLSKTLAPGYRIGWCSPGKFRDRFLEVKIMQTVSATNPTQAAMAQFFNTGRYDLHIKKLRKALQLASMQYLEAIAKYFPAGTKVTKPMGGFVLWVELDKSINAIDLFHKALDEDVSIWPGSIFSASPGFENFIRISFGLPFNDMVDNSLRLLGSLARP